MESLSRLWWFAENPNMPYKIVFLDFPFGGGFTAYSVLEALGITRDRMEIITEPTRFKEIIVPEESIYMWSGFRAGWETVFNLLQERAGKGEYEKVYLSRTRLKKQDAINEIYFENFYRNRGYQIIYPEQHSFLEQVSILYGAKEVVCTNGTLVHMLLFCSPGTKAVVLNRDNDIQKTMLYSLQVRKLDYSIIDVNYNFLPVAHSGKNVFFYGPTIYWKQYLQKKRIPYSEDEISFDIHVKPLIYDYLLKWAGNYKDIVGYKRIYNCTMADVIKCIYRAFGGEQINLKGFPEADKIVKLRKENAVLQKEISNVNEAKANTKSLNDNYEILIGDLKRHIKYLEGSVSWRITRPLRKVRALQKRIMEK